MFGELGFAWPMCSRECRRSPPHDVRCGKSCGFNCLCHVFLHLVSPSRPVMEAQPSPAGC
eukprot:9201542-Prorocentrum_lima.AAC.1